MLDYIGTQGVDWDPLWGWLGLVPKECMKATRKDQANLKKAAQILLKAGHDMWVNRVNKVLEWVRSLQEEAGIKEKKKEVKGQGWDKPQGGTYKK